MEALELKLRGGPISKSAPARYRPRVLAEPGHALTDLTLGLVAVVLAIGLRRSPAVHHHWRSALWWFGVAALAGAVHHGLILRWPDVADPSWALISLLVVVAVSFLLAGTVHDVLGGRHRRTFWLLRSVGIAAYVVIALTGHAGIQAILACESLTMASILGLWAWAGSRGHPRAPMMLLAITASGAAAFTKLVGADVGGLDPTSIYHLAQIPGLVLLFAAVGGVSRRPSSSWAVPARSAP
jgi:hypothetical protein